MKFFSQGETKKKFVKNMNINRADVSEQLTL